MSTQLDMNSLFETTNHKILRRLETYDKILQHRPNRIEIFEVVTLILTTTIDSTHTYTHTHRHRRRYYRKQS